jgi:hypothetical protein
MNSQKLNLSTPNMLGGIGGILLIFFVIAAIIGDGNTFLAVVGALLAYGLAIFAVINLKNVLIELSITLNQNLFDMSGKFIFWGTILLIILIGSVAVFIGYILLTIAFFTAPKEIELANNNVLNLDSTVNKS